MTDISKEAVDALLQGVTDGPWEAWPHDNDKTAEMFWYVSGNSHGIIVEVDEGDDGVVATSIGITAATVSANARFIAAARELAPALRAALDEAEAREAALLAANEINRETLLRHNADCDRRIRKAEAERDAANALLRETTSPALAPDWCDRVDAHLGAKP